MRISVQLFRKPNSKRPGPVRPRRKGNSALNFARRDNHTCPARLPADLVSRRWFRHVISQHSPNYDGPLKGEREKKKKRDRALQFRHVFPPESKNIPSRAFFLGRPVLFDDVHLLARCATAASSSSTSTRKDGKPSRRGRGNGEASGGNRLLRH